MSRATVVGEAERDGEGEGDGELMGEAPKTCCIPLLVSSVRACRRIQGPTEHTPLQWRSFLDGVVEGIGGVRGYRIFGVHA